MIIGGFGLNFIRPMPVVQVSVHLPGLTSDFVILDFLVDSGSTDTCIHPQDARGRLSISDAMLSSSLLWPSIRTSRGVGGMAMSYLHPAIYGFTHDDGHVQYIHEDIHVAQSTPTNTTLPSIMGWDILRFFRIELDYVGIQVTLR